MNQYGLFKEGSATPIRWSCGQCGGVYPREALAKDCCRCAFKGCAVAREGNRAMCKPHDAETREQQRHEELEKERKRFAKAKKLTEAEYEGWVYSDYVGGPNDGFFCDIEDLLEHCHSHDVEPPEYVWACKEQHPRTDAGHVLSNALQDSYEDAAEDFDPQGELEAELQKLLDGWWESHPHTWYVYDYSTAITLTRADDQAAACDRSESDDLNTTGDGLIF